VKPLWWILGGLAALAIALAVQVMGRPEPPPDCTSRVIISRGPHGEPVECVCVGGTISTCFDPGP
jgi:hypothetical protein